MKKVIVCGVLFLSALIFNDAKSQVRLNVNINIGDQPAWGPVGYDYVEYYYLPDIEAYYYVPSRQFVYYSDNGWVFSRSLPPRYSSYNLYTGYKVVVNEPRAYSHFKTHKVKYANYRGNHSQVIIRNSKEKKYHPARGNGGNKGHGNKHRH